MRDYEREGVQPETAAEALRESYANSDLTDFVRSFIGPKPPTRKEELLALVLGLLEDDEQLRLTWGKLNPTERSKAAQTAWSDTGFFDGQKFDAQQEAGAPRQDAGVASGENDEDADVISVMFGRIEGRKRKRSLLEIIMPHGIMPRQTQKQLRKFVPKPERPIVRVLESPPQTVDMPIHRWNAKTNSYDRGTESVPVVVRQTQRDALQDVIAVLRLVDAGKVGVTEKNRWPTPAGIRQAAEVLAGGDYYPAVESKSKKSRDDDEEEASGPILAFAWPMLLQAGKLTQVRGPRLELTKSGRAALLEPPHETIRALWEGWVKTDLLDELRRINVIRGQTGKGARYLTDPAKRRNAVAAALRECAIGEWVALDEFSRHMRAAGHDFDVTSDPWTLYILEQQYGSLGYEGFGGWNILQFRYLLCLLMEYAAALGLIDVGFIPPSGARPDYGGMWGTDDLAFFSRYDGLMFLRLNALGAFALGLTDSYEAPPLEARKVIRVEESLNIVATAPLTSADVLLLDAFAEKTGDRVWRLDPARFLDAQAAGRSAAELTAFLKSGSSGEDIPESVDAFVNDLVARANALTDLGPARLIGCGDPALAGFLANHPVAGKVCSLAGPDKVVVAAKDEAAFDRALRKLGFVLRRGTP